MPTLADIYSLIDSAKRRAADTVQNPGASLSQFVESRLDPIRNLGVMSRESAEETARTGQLFGPKMRQLGEQYAESYNPGGMAVIPFGKARKVVVPAGQENAPVNPVEIRARQAIDDLIKQSNYFGIDASVNHQNMPVGSALAYLDSYLGQNPQVAALPENAKASLRNLWTRAEEAGKAYKRVYGQEKFTGVPEPEPYKSTFLPFYDMGKVRKLVKKGEQSQEDYERKQLINQQSFEKAKKMFADGDLTQEQFDKYLRYSQTK